MKSLNASTRQLLDSISNQLIPWATNGTGFVLLDTPPKVIGSNQVTERAGKILFKKDAARYGSPVISWHWYEENLNSISVPYMGCVVDGEADIVLGTTTETCRKMKIPGRRWVIQMPQKCFFLLPPGIPISAGIGPHWQRQHPDKAYSHIFWAQIHDNGCECHFSTTRDGKLWSHPHFFIPSEHLFPLVQNMLSEMSVCPPDYIAMTYLHLSLMFRYMARSLKQGFTQIPQKRDLLPGGLTPPMNTELQMQRAIDYIDANLANSDLTAEKIAMHTRLSVSQLNRHFHRQFNVPVMRYVWKRRLDQSRDLLLQSSHNIMQIGYRCGFAHTSSFIEAFIRTYGTSPTRFRQQNIAMSNKANE